MKEITREQSNKILETAAGGVHQKAVMCAFGKWYDVRGKTNEEIREFSHSLIHEKFGVQPVIKEIDINLNL